MRATIVPVWNKQALRDMHQHRDDSQHANGCWPLNRLELLVIRIELMALRHGIVAHEAMGHHALYLPQ